MSKEPQNNTVPEIQDKAPKPPGVIAKNRQSLIMLAAGGLIVAVITFSNSSGTSAPKPRATAAGAGGAASPASPKAIQEYARQLDENARTLAQERAKAEQMQTQAARLMAGPQNPYQNPYLPPQQAGNGSGTTQTGISPEEAARVERRKRDEDSLKASNVALSFRKNQPEPNNAAASTVQSELANVQQLIDAEKAALLTSMPTTGVPTQAPRAELKSASPPTPQSGTAPPQTDLPDAVKGPVPLKKQEASELQQASGKLFRLFEGTIIETVLTNRLNGTFSSPVDVMVTTPVYSHDRQHLLIPQGSRVLGEVQRVAATGQQRLAVAFHRLVMPDGFAVSLDQFKGLNQIGETGLKDKADQHYIQIFGASLALGAVAGIEQAGAGYGYNTSGLDLYRQGVAESLSSSATRILDRFLNVLPTITIREGHRIKVYLTNDLLIPAYENHRVPADL
jgi:type IV secretion system protein VirB10